MRAGHFIRDLGQRGVALALVLEAVLEHEDGVGLAAPGAHQLGAWLEAEHGMGRFRPGAVFGLARKGGEFALNGWSETTQGSLLQLVSDDPDQQIAAELVRRLRAQQRRAYPEFCVRGHSEAR
jgi:hypothetical protein